MSDYKKICISNRQLLTGTSDYNPEIRQKILSRIALIAENDLADAIILREKDLDVEQYRELALAAYEVCRDKNIELILHHFTEVMSDFPEPLPIHLSVPDFLNLKKDVAKSSMYSSDSDSLNFKKNVAKSPVYHSDSDALDLKKDVEKSSRYPSIQNSLNSEKKIADGIVSADQYPILGVSTHTVEEAIQAERLGASYITASHIFPTACKEGLAPRGLSYLKEVCQAVSIPVYALGGIHQAQIASCIEAGASGVCMMSEYFNKKENL